MNLHIVSISVILRCNYRHVQFYFKLHSYPLPEKENYQKKKKVNSPCVKYRLLCPIFCGRKISGNGLQSDDPDL